MYTDLHGNDQLFVTVNMANMVQPKVHACTSCAVEMI